MKFSIYQMIMGVLFGALLGISAGYMALMPLAVQPISPIPGVEERAVEQLLKQVSGRDQKISEMVGLYDKQVESTLKSWKQSSPPVMQIDNSKCGFLRVEVMSATNTKVLRCSGNQQSWYTIAEFR